MLLEQFIPTLIFFFFLGLVWSVTLITKGYHRRKKRRSPFPEKFLRGPGQSLVERLQDINTDLETYLSMLLVFPVLLYATFISDLYFTTSKPNSLTIAIYVAAAIVISGFFMFKIIQLFNIRRSTRLGYDGEVAVGQELNLMMHHGYFVFHDFVAEKFNIDHVVVGPAGVFAIETKARAKPTSGNKSADAKVTYDGRCLHFPSWKEVKPLEQAKNQAVWLERWLSSATGEKTMVRPVLALPGWYITRTSSDGIPVINPKQFLMIAKPANGNALEDRRVKSIAHQIEQRCRNIESKAAEGLGGSNT